MKRFSAHVLVSALVLTACPDGGKETTTVATTTDTTVGGTTSASDTSGATDAPTTMDPTSDATTTPTTSDPTTDPTSATSTTEPTSATSTTDPTDATSTTDATTDATTNVMGMCGNGVTEEGEACDDSNLTTELSMSTMQPLQYEAAQCIDDCSLVLALCGDGTVDAGEACDDGNQDSYDACTTSCTVNDKGYHAPCTRMCNQNCDTDVKSGTFTGCENVEVPDGAEGVCYVSTKFALAPRHFAEGECAVTAQKCDGGFLCPPDIGDYDLLTDCPTGTTLIDRTTMAAGITVKTKTCQKVCESDSDCRWNAYDAIWTVPGQFRCQTTADAEGVKICADGQN